MCPPDMGCQAGEVCATCHLMPRNNGGHPKPTEEYEQLFRAYQGIAAVNMIPSRNDSNHVESTEK